jgi:hypothetical protein
MATTGSTSDARFTELPDLVVQRPEDDALAARRAVPAHEWQVDAVCHQAPASDDRAGQGHEVGHATEMPHLPGPCHSPAAGRAMAASCLRPWSHLSASWRRSCFPALCHPSKALLAYRVVNRHSAPVDDGRASAHARDRPRDVTWRPPGPSPPCCRRTRPSRSWR